MAMSMHANPEALRNLGQNILSDASSYKAEVDKIYATVDNLSTSWKGPDNQEFVNKVNEYKDVIGDLGKMINNYGQFLVDTGNNIERITNEIKSSASNI